MTKDERTLPAPVGIDHAGTKITLPADPTKMSILDAIETLNKVQAELETLVNAHEIINTFPLDGAYAFMKAMKRRYGWASPLPPSFFRSPPATIKFEIEHGVQAEVVWGQFAFPQIEGLMQCDTTTHEGRNVFCISARMKKKSRPEFDELVALTREIVRTESIYKGKAFRLHQEGAELDLSSPPTFLDLSTVREDELILNEGTYAQVAVNIFTPIEKTDLCKSLGVPLKRAVILSGDYGVGKTMILHTLAAKCVRHGWTFILIRDVRALPHVVPFARMYKRVLIAAEDIDRIVEGNERTSEIDTILNTFDGVESKGTEVMGVFTTNHADRINPAMLRPGRTDTLIKIDKPNEQSVARLIRLYGRDMIAKDEDLSPVLPLLANHIPAVIREVTERAKLYAVHHAVGPAVRAISAADLVLSAKQMSEHLRLLNGAPTTKTLAEEYIDVMRRVHGNGHADPMLDDILTATRVAKLAANNARAIAEDVKEDTAAIREAVA